MVAAASGMSGGPSGSGYPVHLMIDRNQTINRLWGIPFFDLGGDGSDPLDDYPDFAARLGHAVRDGEVDRGILICGSGVGASVAANKIRGVRAAVCHDTYSAHQGVEHDDMNVLTLGSRVIGPEPAFEASLAFLAAKFSGEPRHVRRLNKVLAIEAAEG